jgi:hypothetical protein
MCSPKERRKVADVLLCGYRAMQSAKNSLAISGYDAAFDGTNTNLKK